MTLLFIFVSLCQQTTHCIMTKTMMSQIFCHVILHRYISVPNPIPQTRDITTPSPYLHVENRSPFKGVKRKCV